MSKYELFVAIPTDVQPGGVKAISKKILSFVEKDGSGGIEKTEYLGVRKFAYQINKNSKGRCYILYFNAQPGVIPSVNSYLNVNESIIRFLITKVKDFLPGVSPLTADKNTLEPSGDDKDYAQLFDKISS